MDKKTSSSFFRLSIFCYLVWLLSGCSYDEGQAVTVEANGNIYKINYIWDMDRKCVSYQGKNIPFEEFQCPDGRKKFVVFRGDGYPEYVVCN